MSHREEETVTWIACVDELPDDDYTVMIFGETMSDPVWLGWHDDDGWHLADGVSVEEITHWAEMPEGPCVPVPPALLSICN